MKLNTWQWVGIVAIVVGGILYFVFRTPSAATGPVIHAPQTMPAT